MMKKFLLNNVIILLLLIPFNLFPETAEPEECWVHIKIDPEVNAPGVLSWDSELSACNEIGIDCEMVRCEDYCKGELFKNSNNIYSLKLKINNIKLRIKDSTNNWIIFNRPVSNYIFNNTYYIIIDNCPTKPFLNNLRFELEGIITDAQGYFTVYIPTGTY